MGTSKGYSMPTGGPWTPLKADATRFVNGQANQEGDATENVTPRSLISQYLAALGGPTGLAGVGTGASAIGTGSGRGSRGGSRSTPTGTGRSGNARSGVRVGANIGNFLSRVSAVGLNEALREAGLEELIGKSPSEIKVGLLDALAGPSSTIDDQAARGAWAELEKELLADALTPEDVERVLTSSLDTLGLDGLLIHYFALYIYERFCRDFYERWVKAQGSEATGKAMKAVKNYIEASVRSKTASRDVKQFRWKGTEGHALAAQVLGDTCAVFGVPA